MPSSGLHLFCDCMDLNTRGKACSFEPLGAEPGGRPEACGSSRGGPNRLGHNSPKHCGHRLDRLLPHLAPHPWRGTTLPNHRRIPNDIRASCPIADSRIVKSMAPSNARTGHSRLGCQALNSASLTSTAGHPQDVGLGMLLLVRQSA